MGIIDDELQEVRKLCENVILGSKLITCVQSMVRVEIKRSPFKALVVCLQFPQDYPSSVILFELKSKTLSDRLLIKLTNICEQELKKKLGKPQILSILRFVRNFLDENPLCVCYDEIAEIKKSLSDSDELKLKQKTSSVQIKIIEGKYYVKIKLHVPDDYPLQSVRLEVESNFPPSLERYLVGQGRERARQCVEPPLWRAERHLPFQPAPSLLSVGQLFIAAAHFLPAQHCQGCHLSGLPEDPQDAEMDENADKHIERLYCNHLFHLDCFITYMKTPPFQGGKKCPECGERIYHSKWRLSERIAEERWAHAEAKRRELQDVAMAFL